MKRALFVAAMLLTITGLLVGLFIPVFASPSIEDLQNTIAQRSEKIKSLEESIKATKAQIGELERSERTLANEIARLEAQIRALTLDIELTGEQISALELELEQLSLEIQKLEKEIGIKKERTAGVIKLIDISGFQTLPLTLVLSANSFSEAFDNLSANERLEGELVGIIADLREAKGELEEKQKELGTKKQELEAKKETLQVQNTLLSGEQNEREELLRTTQRQESRFRQTLQQLEVKQHAAEREIYQLESQLRRLINPALLPGKGVLSWPVEEIRITQSYGCIHTSFAKRYYAPCDDETGGFHNGLDVAPPPPGSGEPILAAAPGTVVGTGNLGRYAYGRWIAIDHHNGLVTLYGHLSSVAVAKGQTVDNQQVIAYEGATGLATGAHLHFTVYASETFHIEERSYGLLPVGASLDPLDFL